MFFRYTLFSIIWAIIILLFTLMPGHNMPSVDLFIPFDKFAHAFVFAVQVVLLIVGFTKQYTFQFLRENSVFLGISLAVIYGVVIELIQSLIPGRSLEFADIISDISGCLIGWAIFYIIYKL